MITITDLTIVTGVMYTKGVLSAPSKSFGAIQAMVCPIHQGFLDSFHGVMSIFFLLDGRYHRHPSNAVDSEVKSQLGVAQLQWLIDALTSSKASFKVVVGGGQFLSPFDHYEGYAQFGHERDELLGELTQRKIEGVFFLSGDRHHAELVKIQPDNMYALFDFTSSPLTSRGAGADRELNSPVRVEGTLIRKKRNFGVLEFFGPPQNRQVALIAYDDSGEGTLETRLACSRTQILRIGFMRSLCVLYLSLLTACAGSPPTPATVPETHHLDASHFMFLVALEPPNAFTDESDRKSLWAALRGEVPTYRTFLGNVDDVPFDYRVEFSFNHSDPSQPDTQFHRIRRWADRLPKMEQLKVQKAKTLVLIQGALRPLKNDMQVRFALATLLFLCERYDGVAFDLLTRKALSASMLRTRLSAKIGSFPIDSIWAHKD